MTRSLTACGVAALAFAAAIAARPHRLNRPRRRRDRQEGTGDSRSRDCARYARRHQPRQLHAGTQLHAGPRQPGQPAQDGEGRARRVVLHRLRGTGTAHAGRLRRRLPAGGGEVRRDPSADREDRTRQDRARADGRRRAAHQQGRQEDRAHRRRERLFARRRIDRGQARQGVLRPRRALSLAGAQRPQPARRLEHRRSHRRVAAQRPQRSRQAGHRRDESRRHHGRPVSSVRSSPTCRPSRSQRRR